MRVLSSLIESDDGEIVRGSLTFNLHYVSRMKWVQARNVQVRGFHQTKITSNIHWQVKCYIQFSVTSAGFYSSDIRVSQYAPWMSEPDWVLCSENIKQFNPNKNNTTGGLLMPVCLASERNFFREWNIYAVLRVRARLDEWGGRNEKGVNGPEHFDIDTSWHCVTDSFCDALLNLI